LAHKKGAARFTSGSFNRVMSRVLFTERCLFLLSNRAPAVTVLYALELSLIFSPLFCFGLFSPQLLRLQLNLVLFFSLSRLPRKCQEKPVSGDGPVLADRLTFGIQSILKQVARIVILSR